MGFILKIFFHGLVVFVPSDDGHVSVVLVDAREPYALSNGSSMESHFPLLLARAGRCPGRPHGDLEIVASTLFPSAASSKAKRDLGQLLCSGVAWSLDSSILELDYIGATSRPEFPTTRVERETGNSPSNWQEAQDFAWVPRLQTILNSESTGEGWWAVDPDVLAERPVLGLIVARLRLDRGSFKTRRLVRFDDDVVELRFGLLSQRDNEGESAGTDNRLAYSQAAATWVSAEIPVGGCSLTLRQRNFITDEVEEVDLAPEDCSTGLNVVEIALLNVPPSTFRPPSGEKQSRWGEHFEIYYELLERRPPNRRRPVPFIPENIEERAWNWPPQEDALLIALTAQARGPHARPICPLVRF